MKITIPQYVSTFDLEEARLGQALERCRHEMPDVDEALVLDLLKKTLRKIKEESVNAEFALDFVSKQFKETDIQDVTTRLLFTLLKKTAS